MFHHFAVFTPASYAESAIFVAARSAWIGVDLFFVLSGFLITWILLRSRGSDRYFSSFYARRTLRIFPLYYAVIFVALVILPRIPAAEAQLDTTLSHGHAWWYWLYLQNILMSVEANFSHLILAVTWSLAVEEQFYLLWPFVVWWLDARRLAWCCVGLMGLALVLRLGLVGLQVTPIAGYTLMPTRVDALAAGSLIACFRHADVDASRLARGARWFGTACAVGLLTLAVVRGQFAWPDPWVQTLGYSLVAVGGASLLTLLLQPQGHRWWIGCFSRRPLVWLGRVSYAMYLFHVPLGAATRKLVWGFDEAAGPGVTAEHAGATAVPWVGDRLVGLSLMMLSCLAVTFVAALASWHLYETQFLKLKRYFPRAEA